MKSTVNFDLRSTGNPREGLQPVITARVQLTPDSRDIQAKYMFEQLGDSSWMSVKYEHPTNDPGSSVDYLQQIVISPIRPDELEETINIIRNRLPAKKDDRRFIKWTGSNISDLSPFEEAITPSDVIGGSIVIHKEQGDLTINKGNTVLWDNGIITKYLD